MLYLLYHSHYELNDLPPNMSPCVAMRAYIYIILYYIIILI